MSYIKSNKKSNIFKIIILVLVFILSIIVGVYGDIKIMAIYLAFIWYFANMFWILKNVN